MITICLAIWLGCFTSLIASEGRAATAAHQYLAQAETATAEIGMTGDQSAARMSIALTYARTDPQRAITLAGGIQRPVDAARALVAATVPLTGIDMEGAAQNFSLAGRMLLRVPDPNRRAMEQRLLLREAALREELAMLTAPELSPGEAQSEIVLGLARMDPKRAQELRTRWQLRGQPADESAALIAVGLAREEVESALEVSASIMSAAVRERVVWRIAERRPPEEALGICIRVTDPIVRSGLLGGASVRAEQAGGRLEGVLEEIEVARDSVRAELAVETSKRNMERGREAAQALPKLAREWTLSRTALHVANTQPETAERLMEEARPDPAVYAAALVKMVEVDRERALRLARALPAGLGKDAVLAQLAIKIANTDSETAESLLWEIEAPRWRSRAVEAVAVAISQTEPDKATGLIGLVPRVDDVRRIRARVAGATSRSHPQFARRILETMPVSAARTEGAIEAWKTVLAGGGSIEAANEYLKLGPEYDLALRWALPEMARRQERSPLAAAERIGNPYLRALALVDIARGELGGGERVIPAPDRGRLIRPIIEWEMR